MDAYRDPGEARPISQAKPPGRMERITADDAVEKVELWRRRYASAALGGGGG